MLVTAKRFLRRTARPARLGGLVACLVFAIARLLRDHPYADTLARAGHDLVHDRFCIQLMVKAVEAIYDEGARSVRAKPLPDLADLAAS